MARPEASWGSLLLALVALGLVAASFALPWYSYDSSTGRKTAAGGPQDPSDTRVERHGRDFYPFRQAGDATPTDAAAASRAVLWMGIGATVAAVALLATLVADALRFRRDLPRWLSLGALLVAVAGVGAALAVAWFAIAPTMSGYGVHGTFSDQLLPNGYVHAKPAAGWALAALALPAALGAFAFRFQAGAQEAAAVEALA